MVPPCRAVAIWYLSRPIVLSLLLSFVRGRVLYVVVYVLFVGAPSGLSQGAVGSVCERSWRVWSET